MGKFKTEWTLGQPNITSAKIKNKNRICAYHDCNNELSSPSSTGFLGVEVCDNCRKNINLMLKKIQTNTDKENVEFIEKNLTSIKNLL